MDTDGSVLQNLLYVWQQQHQEHYQCRSAQKAAERKDGGYDAILAAASFRAPPCSALLLFLRLLDLDKGPRGRAHTTLAHMGMCTQNILENPKMECLMGISPSPT